MPFILFACLVAKTVHCQSLKRGCYAGLQEMCQTEGKRKSCYTDPSNPREKWYHLTHIRVDGDSAFVAQDPIGIYKKDTMFSASDGGFYYYKGKVNVNNGQVIFDLRMITCDYCPMPEDSVYRKNWTHKTLTGRILPKGMLINGYLFQPELDSTRCRVKTPSPGR